MTRGLVWLLLLLGGILIGCSKPAEKPPADVPNIPPGRSAMKASEGGAAEKAAPGRTPPKPNQ